MEDDWIDGVKSRGLTGAFSVVLDVLEPLGPLGAQVLYVAQPLAGVFGWRRAVGDLADALETPGGVDALRRRLSDDARSD
jgi:hypothetical protein